jgi:DNA polymerase I-like protein with 3'-5' exonuclease and polymerase domains
LDLNYDDIAKDSDERFVGKVCNLSLIYGTGDEKLKNTVRIQSGGKITIPMGQATMLKNTYRETNQWVVEQWTQGGMVLDCLLNGQTMEFLRDGIIQVTREGLVKPGGLVLPYPDLRKAKNQEGYQEYTYQQKRGMRDKVYGSKVYQRCIQSLARDIIGDMVLELDKLFGVVLQVHDEIVCIVPEQEADKAKAKMLEVMSTPRDWYEDLPLAAEAGYGRSYGEAK